MKCIVQNCKKQLPPWRIKNGNITCGKSCSMEWNHTPVKLREKIRGKKYGVKMIEDKKTTFGLFESTLGRFNLLKVENKFKSSDDFLLMLLNFYSKNNKKTFQFIHKPIEKPKVFKEQSTNNITKNNDQKKQ